MQEEKLAEPVPPIDAKRFMPPVASAAPSGRDRQAAADLLRNAKHPVILAGRVSRDRRGLERAHRAGRAARCARRHRSEGRAPPFRPIIRCTPARPAPSRRRRRPPTRSAPPTSSSASTGSTSPAPSSTPAAPSPPRSCRFRVDHHLHNGWSMDYQGLPPVDVMIACEPDAAVPPAARRRSARPSRTRCRAAAREPFKPAGDKLTVDHLADALRRAVGERPASLTHVSLSWNGASWPFRHPLDYLGSDGGGGVGGGPGISVGAALALKGRGRLPVAVCGDGDFLMGVHRALDRGALPHPAADRGRQQPLVLQRRTAPGARRAHAQPPGREPLGRPAHFRARHRPRRHGARARRARLRPGRRRSAISRAVFAKAIAAVEAGEVAVVDVRVEPGYTAAMTAVMTRKSE